MGSLLMLPGPAANGVVHEYAMLLSPWFAPSGALLSHRIVLRTVLAYAPPPLSNAVFPLIVQLFTMASYVPPPLLAEFPLIAQLCTVPPHVPPPAVPVFPLSLQLLTLQ
jgi:hypothetical protein